MSHKFIIYVESHQNKNIIEVKENLSPMNVNCCLLNGLLANFELTNKINEIC